VVHRFDGNDHVEHTLLGGRAPVPARCDLLHRNNGIANADFMATASGMQRSGGTTVCEMPQPRNTPGRAAIAPRA
jgi:hypothetical protein